MIDVPDNKYLNKEMLSLLSLMPKVGVAVSGGSDSVAMFLILLDLIGADKLMVLHFDHNLRKESSSEARWVADLAEKHKVECAIGRWDDAKNAEGNLMQAARQARYEFLKKQCYDNGLSAVCVGHTADDIAETFLIRLGKGSGLQGLSAMREAGETCGCTILRPLLMASRDALKFELEERAQAYLSDPSNENEKFQRPRVRNLKSQLEEAGIPFSSIASASLSLSRANETVSYFEGVVYKHAVDIQELSKCAVVDYKKFTQSPEEIRIRILGRVIADLTGQGLAPRTSKRVRLLGAMAKKGAIATLGGVQFIRDETHITCKVLSVPESAE